ncbi:transglutaminase TgpA family protein [Denitrificimonas caeni]|uniref:transglutaminase TgpA family protein n=1 Tax=Denitrificimonas caeni TaxID=521720 RepID=UPI0019638DE4|nr:DUF3488 and transglutaminase-like domain-containing protein [Denitrificimonas caeni]
MNAAHIRKVAEDIPRISLVWLLVAQVLVIIPHVLHVPLWLLGLWLGCAVWRVQVFRMRVPFPNSWVKAALMLSSGFAVYLSRGSLVGLDAAVALLITAFILKLLEMRTRRDALVLIFLGFFAVVTSYLFADGLLAALYSILPVIALLAALLGLQQSSFAAQPLLTLKLASRLFAQAIPLMVLLFVLFPRLEPLWSLPQAKEQGTVGLSSSMTPGDLADLGQSSALAFRARFDGAIPAQSQLYWRALTLPHFDGRSWSISQRLATQEPQWQAQGEALSYSIIMQPSTQPWLFALDVGSSEQADIRLMSDFRLQRSTPVNRAYQYQATSWPKALRQPQLSQMQQHEFLQLPRAGNPQTRDWAQTLRQQYPDDNALVAGLLQHFNQQPYHYTLKSPLLGKDSVDEFLFSSRRGFCAHYAGAMVFTLRAAGIPSRVVAGYLGGETNQAGQFVQVRQFDAHAWVEYWQLGQGWRSVDPTFQVAPERIERGVQDALKDEVDLFQGDFLSPLRYQHIAWINQLRMSWERLNHSWQTQILGYQRERQQAWLKQWFGQVDWQTIGLFLVLSAALIIALLVLWMFKPWQRQSDPLQRIVNEFQRVLQRRGFTRQTGEGLRSFWQRIRTDLPEEQQPAVIRFIELYEQQQYAQQLPDLVVLRRALAEIKK